MQNGHQLSLFKDPETGKIRGLQYDIDDKTAVAEEALGNGVVLATQEPLRYVSHPIAMQFVVESSLDSDAAKHNIPKPVLERLKEALKYRLHIDQLKAGTAFKLIYEEHVSRDGSHRQIGDLDAVQVKTDDNNTVSAFYFRDEYGMAHFYDEAGNPTTPQFLRFPVKFQYISSGFSASRYHPILHRYRPHIGVDFAAQYGTPVKAVADGRVGFSDWDGELGRCVRLQHQQELMSLYGHLSKISPEVKPGAVVHTGQVIGWVGASGLATGPHLHFALYKGGNYIDPMTVKYTRGSDISFSTRPLFEKIKREYLEALGKLPESASHRTSASLGKPAISPMANAADTSQKQPSTPPKHHRHVVDRDVELGAGS